MEFSTCPLTTQPSTISELDTFAFSPIYCAGLTGLTE